MAGLNLLQCRAVFGILVVRADSLLDCLQQRRNGLDQLDEDAREIQEFLMRDKDRHGALDAIKTRTGIARAQTGVDQLFANVTGQLGTPSPQNVLIQVLALPKIGETLMGFHRAIECQAVPDLQPAHGVVFSRAANRASRDSRGSGLARPEVRWPASPIAQK
jgi:hypothetical protein